MKYEHWRLEFSDREKVQYVVRIYREQDAPAPVVVLVGGASPFVTEEDASENVFEPVRGQTATLSIVTGDQELIKELVPRNNTERPMVLARKGETEDEVVWCGYLSCESYSQPYTSREDKVSIHCNSYLQMMDSHHYNRHALPAYGTIADLFYYMVLGREEDVWGSMPLYIPADSENILTKYIMAGYMYDSTEVVDDSNGIDIEVKSVSGKKILEAVCGLMGWQLREWNGSLLFYKFDYEGAYHLYDIEHITDQGNHLTPMGTVTTEMVDMLDFDWHGTGHSRSIVSGARKVSVKANVEKMEMLMSMYDAKYAHLCDDRTATNMPPYTNSYKWVFYYPNNRENNMVVCKQGKLSAAFDQGQVHYAQTGAATSFEQLRYDLWKDGAKYIGTVHNDAWRRMQNIQHAKDGYTGAGESITVGALKCRIVQSYAGSSILWHRYTSGLYILGASMLQWPGTTSEEVVITQSADAPEPKYPVPLADTLTDRSCEPVYVQESEKEVHLNGGYLKLDIRQYEHNFDTNTGMPGGDVVSGMYVTVMIGNKAWKGWRYGQSDGWQNDNMSNPAYRVFVRFDKARKMDKTDTPVYETGEGYYIPLPDEPIEGVVRVFVYPMLIAAKMEAEKKGTSEKKYTFTMDRTFDRALIEGISLEYVPPMQYKALSEAEENIYSRLNDDAYTEDMEIEVEIGSDRDNQYSERILRLNDKYPLTQLVYRKNGQPVGMRPEANLLKRAATYYAKNRDIVEIEISTDVYGPKKIAGAFGETFAPLSISTDWATAHRTVRCYEYETEDNSGYDSNYMDPTSSDRYDTDPQERDHDWEQNYDAPDVDTPDPEGPWGGDPEGGPGHDEDGPDYDGPDYD